MICCCLIGKRVRSARSLRHSVCNDYRVARVAPEAMAPTRRVAEARAEERPHDLQHPRVDGRGGVMVEVERLHAGIVAARA